MTSNGGTEWLGVSYNPNHGSGYKFEGVYVYNANGDIYTQISDNTTSYTNIKWGSTLYILTYNISNNRYESVGRSITLAASWSTMLPDKTQ